MCIWKKQKKPLLFDFGIVKYPRGGGEGGQLYFSRSADVIYINYGYDLSQTRVVIIIVSTITPTAPIIGQHSLDAIETFKINDPYRIIDCSVWLKHLGNFTEQNCWWTGTVRGWFVVRTRYFIYFQYFETFE